MTTQSHERALFANPDDLDDHRRHADWLIDKGDPRGEFARLQIALEAEALNEAERSRLRVRAQELLAEHSRAWLGEPLASHLLDRDDVSFIFGRGWLHSLRLPTIREDLSRIVAESPSLRLLRELVITPEETGDKLDRAAAYATEVLIGTAVYYPDEAVALDPLVTAENLTNLRSLQLGNAEGGLTDVGDQALYNWLPRLPRLEELRLSYYVVNTERLFGLPLPNLRTLHVTGVFTYDLEALARNPTLDKLSTLLIEPAAPGGHQKLMVADVAALLRSTRLPSLSRLQLRFCATGDDVCEELIASGMLRRLTDLDLQWSEITDKGATLLADCADVAHLTRLDLSGNQISADGIARLRQRVGEVTFA